jgi:cyclic pyranopterin phosphate synthase
MKEQETKRMTEESELTHFDQKGNAIMVDVTEKLDSVREATAIGRIQVNEKVFEAVKARDVQKGDVLGVARVAGIMGAKKTSELIPMCHILNITKASIDFEMLKESLEIEVSCTVKVTGKTGVEMEALTGAGIALLTIYDMCKAIDKEMEIREVYLKKKTGGKSGEFIHSRK